MFIIIIEYYSLSTTGTNTDNGAGTGTTVNNDTNENAKFNLRHEIDQHKNEKQNNGKNGKRPVIFWGTHHKTGTYLAQKMFALLCSRQSWCCVFQPTR